MKEYYRGGVENGVELRLSTQNSNITMEHTAARLNIEGNTGSVRIDKTDAKMDIYSKDPKIEIHNYPAYKQLGYKNIVDLFMQDAADGERGAMSAAAEMAANGDEMMKIENKGADPIVSISQSNGERFSRVSLNIAHFPEEPIDISVREGYLNISASSPQVNVESVSNLKITYNKGNISINVDQYPKVNVEAVGNILDINV